MTRIQKRIDSFLYDTGGYSTQRIAVHGGEGLYRTEHTPVWGTFQMFLAGVDDAGEEYITLIRLKEAVEWIRRTQKNPEKLIESVSGAYILLPEDPLAGCTYCRDFLPGGGSSRSVAMTHNGNLRTIVGGLTRHNPPTAHWRRIARVNKIVTRGSQNLETGLHS